MVYKNDYMKNYNYTKNMHAKLCTQKYTRKIYTYI